MPVARLQSVPRRRAFTLIELLVTIVVVAIAATALTSVYTAMVRGSGDPVIQQQAITAAEAYVEEIMRKSFADPVVAETGGAEGGEGRVSYNDVQDYNDLPDLRVRDQNNGLVLPAAYEVTVNVTPAMFNGVAAMQIDVTVAHTAIGSVTLTAFRTSYP